MSSTSTTTSDLKFSVLCCLFKWILKSKTAKTKRSRFRRFLDTFANPTDYFSALRLILPSLDRERGSYGLKESHLATSIINALAMSPNSEDGQKLINWRKGGAKSAGYLAGNFSAVAADVLRRRQSSVSAGITIGEINSLLDRLASADRNSKVKVFEEMIKKTNSEEMKWIVMIILKDLKLGMSEKSIFQEFHPDAEELFNVTCDLRAVCEKLCDRNERHKRQDIEVGKAVRPQLAGRVSSCSEAWKKLHGKEVVVECKFDGDRIQVHKSGNSVNYYSRNFIDHVEYVHGMNDVIINNVVADKFILDGEMMVWDKASNRFAEFGANQEAAKAAREGVDSERQLCYVVFDILYVGGGSVIHQSLKERQELLRKVVKPVKGRLEILLPSGNESLNAHRRADEPCWSIVVNHVDEVERFFKEMVENRDEGIVVKDLGSTWEPGNRSAKWLKVKPDYVNAGSDLDVLIIGGYYGTGRKGGKIAQFLLGLAERPPPNTYPRKFVSFCKVGTGLSDEELSELVAKLEPYFKTYEYPKKSAPSFYQVTNNSKERPDVWIESPEKSFIVSIASDVRMISSEVFAAPYSLRFPRIDRLRYDKPWHECLDVQTLNELVRSNNGTTQRGQGDDSEGGPGGKKKRARTAKGEGRKKLSLAVPSHFTRTDVSSVKGESRIFTNMVFHFVNVPSDRSLDSLHKLVVENGGTFSMNINDTVTHCVGAQSRGIKYEAAKRRGRDVIHCSWVLDCCSRKQILPLRPNHFVFLSDPSKKKLQEEIDEFSDSYFWDINVAELKQILCDVIESKDAKSVDYYRNKYCPREKWRCLHGCRVYFHLFQKLSPADWEVFLMVVMRRMKVEVSVGGGKVVDNPSQATHIVVLSVPGYQLNFETLLHSFPEERQRLLRRKRIHVVGSQWLEDCVREGQKLPEMTYSLKPGTLEESASGDEEGKNDMDTERQSASDHEKSVPGKGTKITPLIREPRRKRGRPAGTSTRKGKTVVTKPPRPKRARVGKRTAKLQDITSDEEPHEQENSVEGHASPELDMNDQVLPESASYDQSDEKASALGKCAPVVEPSGPGPSSYSSELFTESKEREHEGGLDKMESCSVDNSGSVTFNKPDKETEYSQSGKSEIEADPIKAMLLDLLPSLRMKPEALNPVTEEKKSPPLPPREDSPVVSMGEPVKKKKVSYRELASQLLKDK